MKSLFILQHQCMISRSSRGFTLVELIIVIVILGILSVSAIPRFVDLSDDANLAANDAIASALKGSIDLAKIKYSINGLSGAAINLDGFGDGSLDFNAYGWPHSTNDDVSSRTVDMCVQLWTELLDPAPTISTGTSTEYQAVRSPHNAWADTCYFVSDNTYRIHYNTRTGEVSTP